MILINAKVISLHGNDFENGFIEIDGGRIVSLGDMKDFSSYEGEIIDLCGAVCTPGLIDGHTHLGMWEDSLAFEGDDGNEDTDPSTPQLLAIDGCNLFDRCFKEAAESGVTTVLTGPGSANAIGGIIAAVKTAGDISERVIDDKIAVKMALGENPKNVYHQKSQAPVTRMATAAIIREQLYKAKRYLSDKEKAENDPELDSPEYSAKCEALIPLLKGEVSAHIHAHRADDILTAVRLKNEFGINAVIVHGTDGERVSDILLKENIPVMSGPVICDRSKPELASHSPRTAGALSKKGIKVCIVTDHPVVPINYLLLSAQVCVKNGMTENDALCAMTKNVAEICGIYDRVGSLAVGKDADIAVWDSSPCDPKSNLIMTIISGKTVYDNRR